jgi:hypothetical protein
LFCTTGDLLPEQDIPFELLFATGDEVRQIPLAREQSWYVELETNWKQLNWSPYVDEWSRSHC